ncbi:S8 family serine peptidase [Shewanella seohaensis]|uniref:S8 family serine peptidase n=1 Tax=Shewanella seohaensis TaxID=755175 RepID=A0ABV4VZY9_9GAMM
MNFKLSKIALALPISAFALSVHASKPVEDQATYEITAKKQLINKKSAEASLNNKYFVILKDEPLALYQGGIKGLAATNVKASKNTNVNAKGKLDVTSSKSVTYTNYLVNQQNKVLGNIKSTLKREVPIQAAHTIALNALVMELSEAEAVALRKMPGVLAVQKDSFKQLLTDVGPTHVGAPLVWNNPDLAGRSKGEGLVVGIIDTGIASYKKKFYSWRPPTAQDFNPSFADIGGDGYDHTNPYGEGVYFGDCVENPLWCNDKLVGVVSFDDYKTAVPSSDWRFQTGQDDQGHGTHVAATVAGNVVQNVPYSIAQVVGTEQQPAWESANSMFNVNVSGVAPHANIIAYRTCVPINGCSDSMAIKAIEHAIEHNVDVINYSVGGSPSSPWQSADSLAFLSAREAGVHVAVAAGNSGPEAETVGSPGNSPWVTTVAALSHGRDYSEGKTAVFSGGDSPLPEMKGKGKTLALDTPTEIVYAGNVESEYYQQLQGGPGYCYASAYGSGSLPASYQANNVVGKVVVCRRGGTYNGAPLSRLNKSIAAKYAGAAGLILINSDDSPDDVVGDFHGIPAIHLNKADGDALLSWLSTGEKHMVSILGNSEFKNNPEKADIAASFTSRGPDYVNKDYLVPDVGAPGVEIFASNIGTGMHSTQLDPIERHPGDYMQISGTSMASPHVAGIYLLMKAAHPEWTPAEMQSALMTTAVTSVTEKQYQYDADGNVVRDEQGNPIFDVVRANNHATGAGSARVNLAIQAGLVMNETKAGYLAADPFAPEWAQKEIPGWHGEPSKMNMPSLSKGKCLIECSWTRTFKAVKDGTWTISFENYDDGFTLTADKMSFSLSQGEETTVTFTAGANSGLAKDWVDARVLLTPGDESMPVQTLPVSVNFIAGIAPESVDITAARNNDSAAVKGIVTIGSDNIQSSKSGLAKADIHEFSVRRDATNGSIMSSLTSMDDTVYAIPLNVQADSKRLVIEVLETSSPDLDLYVGVDVNLDGAPTGSPAELPLVRYMSATDSAFEKIDIINPANDTYWILVHNWAPGPEALTDNQMLCESGQQPDEGKQCVYEAPIYDKVKLAVTNVTYDDDSMQLDVADSVAPREELATRVKWDQIMNQGDMFHSVFWLGTTPELSRNIGAVRVNITRGEDDVKVTQPQLEGDMLTSRINLSANNSGEDRVYNFSVELAKNVSVASLISDATATPSLMQMATSDIDYKIEGNVLSWVQTQKEGAPATQFTLVLDVSKVTGLVDITPVISTQVSTSGSSETAVSGSMPVIFEGRPVFKAAADKSSAKKGEQVHLSASPVDMVISDPTISYTWRQVAGTSVAIVGAGTAAISYTAPDVGSPEKVVFELVGSNGKKQSEPVQISVDIEPSKSGGSMGFVMLLLGGVGLIRQRR